MWRRELLERSLSDDPQTTEAEHKKIGSIYGHKRNIMELCIYNLMTFEGPFDPLR